MTNNSCVEPIVCHCPPKSFRATLYFRIAPYSEIRHTDLIGEERSPNNVESLPKTTRSFQRIAEKRSWKLNSLHCDLSPSPQPLDSYPSFAFRSPFPFSTPRSSHLPIFPFHQVFTAPSSSSTHALQSQSRQQPSLYLLQPQFPLQSQPIFSPDFR